VVNCESVILDQLATGPSGTGLNVLQIEDSESDAAMMARLLVKAGYDVHARRVEDESSLRAALAEQSWDVILADYNLPQFSAPAALKILREKQLDIPFIVVSGVIGEETAVGMMKSGAHDYLLKGNMARLAPAVEREIRESRIRNERRQQEQTRLQMARELELRNGELQNALRELQAAVDEKTILMKEIHHRVKNNLAIICSLLSMKAGLSEIDDVKRALEESQQRVRSIALVHEFLYASDKLDRIEFSRFAEQIVLELRSVFAADPARLSVRFDAQPLEIEITQAIPCALILNELVTNAFKYAFPQNRTGKLTISFRDDGPGYLRLCVQDDGVGCSPGAIAGRPHSLGMTIVQTLTNQLQGTLEQQGTQGTSFVLRFPLKAPRRVQLSRSAT
jgi:two-component sensor histidine kinase